MQVTKIETLFQFATDPKNPSAASSHAGGWSEGYWFPGIATAPGLTIQPIAQARARIAPLEVSIIGWRATIYDVNGNVMIPRGTSAGRFLYPGNSGFTIDAPQVCVDISGTAQGGPNSNRSSIRGLPDEICARGEYQPTDAYTVLMNAYFAAVKATAAGIVGRVLTGTNARVQSYAAGSVLLSAAIGGVAGTDFLRFKRCYDQNGNPVKGSFLINTIVGNTYTIVNGPAQIVKVPSGTARIDAIGYLKYATLQVDRLFVKKVGRGFQQYRGRRSKSRV